MSHNFSSRRFKLLANDHRLEVLQLLWRKKQNVTEIAQSLDIEQSLLSHHLALLRQEGLVVSMREGKEVYYSLAESIRGETPGSFQLGCCDIAFERES